MSALPHVARTDAAVAQERWPRRARAELLASPQLRAEIESLAVEQGRDVRTVMAQARRYLREMVSTPGRRWLGLRHWLDRRLWLRGYDADVHCDPAEFDRLRDIVGRHPTLLLFTHKAYGDAALPALVCDRYGLPMLHTFGGINLDLPGLGALLRRSGGIFIRRRFANDPVYRLVLRAYVAYLLERRFPLSWAFEGTRSRIGKLMPPRYGLLKYALDGARAAGLEDLHIVPLVTSFEQIRDVDDYVAEERGAAKRPESLGWLLGYARGAGRPLGQLRVDLGEPVVVHQPPAAGDRLAVARIAFDVAVQANRATPLTVTGVICLVLLGLAPRGVTAVELGTLVQVFAAWARARDIRLGDELAAATSDAFLGRLNALATSGLLQRYEEGNDVVYAVDPAQQPAAAYYRNTVVHHFVPKAFIELALLRALEEEDGCPRDAFWMEADRLRELFKFEFFYSPRDQFRAELVTELDRTDRQWQDHLADRRQAGRLARRLQPYIGHAALREFVEAYAVVLDLLTRQRPGETPSEETCVADALHEGHKAWLLRRVSSEASISRQLFTNGYRLATHLGLTGVADADILQRRAAKLREFRALALRMDRLRIEALARAEEFMSSQRPS